MVAKCCLDNNMIATILLEEISEITNDLVSKLEAAELLDEDFSVPRELAEQLREEIYTIE